MKPLNHSHEFVAICLQQVRAEKANRPERRKATRTAPNGWRNAHRIELGHSADITTLESLAFADLARARSR